MHFVCKELISLGKKIHLPLTARGTEMLLLQLSLITVKGGQAGWLCYQALRNTGRKKVLILPIQVGWTVTIPELSAHGIRQELDHDISVQCAQQLAKIH